jgi:hypothetical protein
MPSLSTSLRPGVAAGDSLQEGEQFLDIRRARTAAPLSDLSRSDHSVHNESSQRSAGASQSFSLAGDGALFPIQFEPVLPAPRLPTTIATPEEPVFVAAGVVGI